MKSSRSFQLTLASAPPCFSLGKTMLCSRMLMTELTSDVDFGA